MRKRGEKGGGRREKGRVKREERGKGEEVWKG